MSWTSDATCKTCPWWYADSKQCRFAPPAVVPTRRTDFSSIPYGTIYEGRSFWPKTSPDSWCGEHPDRKQVFYAEVKEAPAVLTEADVVRIIASWSVQHGGGLV